MSFDLFLHRYVIGSAVCHNEKERICIEMIDQLQHKALGKTENSPNN